MQSGVMVDEFELQNIYYRTVQNQDYQFLHRKYKMSSNILIINDHTPTRENGLVEEVVCDSDMRKLIQRVTLQDLEEILLVSSSEYNVDAQSWTQAICSAKLKT